MLQIKDIFFSIGDMQILTGVTLNINEGETVGIIGPNGSGKTTLFNCISGFCRHQHGKMSFKSSDISHLAPFERARRGIGRVFQNSGIFKEMTVLENLVTAIEARRPLKQTFFPWSAATKEIRRSGMQYLDQVGLVDKADEKAASLSGGQLRLLELVRTMAFGAELFLLDEPTAGVSPRMKDDVALFIRRLQGSGKTVLIIEHDINFIQLFCERIVVLDLGQVVLDDTPEVVRKSPLLEEIYFGRASATKGTPVIE